MTKPIIRSTHGLSNFATELQKVKESAMNSKGVDIDLLVAALKTSNLLTLKPNGDDREKWSVETSVETSIGLKSMKFFVRIPGDLLCVELVQKTNTSPTEINVKKFFISSL